MNLLAVDFDGTLVKNEYPEIGDDVPLAFETLRDLQYRYDVKLILWTMRSGRELAAAVEHCKDRDVHFWGINENPNQKTWTDSPKAYAPVYIDDAALGCPLVVNMGERPYVDWRRVRDMLRVHLGQGPAT